VRFSGRFRLTCGDVAEEKRRAAPIVLSFQYVGKKEKRGEHSFDLEDGKRREDGR